ESERLAPGIELSEESKAEIRRRAEQGVRFIRALRDEAGAEWSRLPEAHRFALVISAALGALTGLVAGLAAPKHVAAITTSFVGAAAWLGAGAILARTHGVVGAESLPSSAAAWVLIWLLVSAIGAALQWTALRPRADKSKE
ncbi:MAG: hypothetical protein VYC34_08600, partial [Planctomycetota bacterium]|nr:hypothetical protein [Planctomycetota bacterium]